MNSLELIYIHIYIYIYLFISGYKLYLAHSVDCTYALRSFPGG